MAHIASSLSTLVPSFGALSKASHGCHQPFRQVVSVGRTVQPRAKYFCGVCSDNKLRKPVLQSGLAFLAADTQAAMEDIPLNTVDTEQIDIDMRKAIATYSAFAALAQQGIKGSSSWTDLGNAARTASAACVDTAALTAKWHQDVSLQESPEWLFHASDIQENGRKEQLASAGVPDQVLQLLATAPIGQDIKPGSTSWAANAAGSWEAMARGLDATAEMLEGAALQGLTSLDDLEEKQADEEVGKLTLLERNSLAVDGLLVEALLLTLQNKMVYQVTNLRTGQYHGSAGKKEAV